MEPPGMNGSAWAYGGAFSMAWAGSFRLSDTNTSSNWEKAVEVIGKEQIIKKVNRNKFKTSCAEFKSVTICTLSLGQYKQTKHEPELKVTEALATGCRLSDGCHLGVSWMGAGGKNEQDR